MKSPSIIRVVSRPTALVQPYHSPRMGQIASLNARKFSTTPRRLFLDECFVQTHTLLTGVHDMTGLPWAASIPLVAVLVRIVILHPLDIYASKVYGRQLKVSRHMLESKAAIEKKIQQVHRNKSALERQKILNSALLTTWRQLLRQNRAQPWRTFIPFINVPICFTMMETIRRMTGTEDGMPTLMAKSLTALNGQQDPGPGTTDEMIPLEPSLATQGMLWFDNLMVPDPSLILPCAISVIIFAMYSSRKGIMDLCAIPGSTLQAASKARAFNLRKNRMLKFGALAVAPATLMFPSAMLLYWISSSLAAVMMGSLARIRYIRSSKLAGKGKPAQDAPKSKPKMQEFRGPTIQDLRGPKKKK